MTNDSAKRVMTAKRTMKLQIQKLGSRHIILNLLANRPGSFTIQVDEKQIPRRCRKRSKPQNAEVLAIRAKYPELKALDELTAGLVVIDDDEALFEEYYTLRAKEEGMHEWVIVFKIAKQTKGTNNSQIIEGNAWHWQRLSSLYSRNRQCGF